MSSPNNPPPDHRQPPFSPTCPRRESVPDNAAFPSVRPLSETLPSPPQYERHLPPGQTRLGAATAATAGPSRVVGFQPISRTISSGANGTSTSSNTPRSALTSARPPEIKSSTSFGDLHPPKDIHDEYKYLHMGDRKMKMVITRGVGPPVGKYGKEGKGKPRKVRIKEVGGRVEGFVEVGKVDGCVGLDLTIIGRSLCTLYYNGQPSMLQSRRLIKQRIDLYPSMTSLHTPTKDKGKGKAVEPTIPHHTTFAFGFDFPRYCELEEAKDGSAAEDDDDDDYPVEKHAAEPSSLGARAIDIAQSASPTGSTDFGKPPSFVTRTTSNASHAEDTAGSSSGFSPSSWKNRMESKSPPSSFGFGKFLKRNSFSTASHGHPASAHSPAHEGEEPKKGFLRRLSTSQSVSRPALEDRYDLPPSINLLLGDLQAEVEYYIRIRLRRRGFRFNDSLMVNCSYEPEHSVQQLERFSPSPDALIQPDYPQWQTLLLSGGHAIAQKGKRQKEAQADQTGIRAEILLPFPLLLTLPPVAHRETAHLPTMPFRLRFHSSLPYQYPLLTFASPETSDWRIHLLRCVTIRIHLKELVRVMPLRCLWKIDTVDTAEPGAGGLTLTEEAEHAPQASRARRRSAETHNLPRTETSPLRGVAVSQVPTTSVSASETTIPPAAPPSFDNIEAEAEPPGTPPPEFAEAYPGPLDFQHPFPPAIVSDSTEENIYVCGRLSLCRSTYKSILAPLNTPDILVEYFLEVEIRPKGGSVKETFSPLKGRWPVMFEKM